jgi:hypothetical protein
MDESWQAPELTIEEWEAVLTALRAVGRRADRPLAARIAAALGQPPVAESEMTCVDVSMLTDQELEAEVARVRLKRQHPYPAAQEGVEDDPSDSSVWWPLEPFSR